LTDLVVDSSALIAILNNEPDALRLMETLDNAESVAVSAATLHEAFCVARRIGINNGAVRLQQMLDLTTPEIVAFDAGQLDTAKLAYFRFGRGTGHRAGLNMGDCFAYALAKTRNLPLLFKGDDFVHTDIEPALKPA
jgi:ribonuclease VapC